MVIQQKTQLQVFFKTVPKNPNSMSGDKFSYSTAYNPYAEV